MIMYSKIASNTCIMCNKDVVYTRHRNRQTMIHKNNRTYRCNVCRRTFYNSGYLTTHVLLHSRIKRHQCEICNQTFKYSINLKTHMLGHSGAKLYQCNVCGKTFSRTHLKTHMLTHRNINAQTLAKTDDNTSRGSDVDVKAHQCDICTKQFRYWIELKAHMLSYKGKELHQSKIYMNQYSMAGIFKRHILTHVGFKPKLHKCVVCSKRFNRIYQLRLHKLMHANIQLHQWEFWLKSFIRRKDLNNHRRLHWTRKPHRCHVCYQTFVFEKTYRHHMLTHPGVSPFQCLLCMKTFDSASWLKKHGLIHSDQTLYRCGICNKTFFRLDNLNRHKQMHSGFLKIAKTKNNLMKRESFNLPVSSGNKCTLNNNLNAYNLTGDCKAHNRQRNVAAKEKAFVEDCSDNSSSIIRNKDGADSTKQAKIGYNQYRVNRIHTDKNKNIKVFISSTKNDKIKKKRNSTHKTGTKDGIGLAIKAIHCPNKHNLLQHAIVGNDKHICYLPKQTEKLSNQDDLSLNKTNDTRNIKNNNISNSVSATTKPSNCTSAQSEVKTHNNYILNSIYTNQAKAFQNISNSNINKPINIYQPDSSVSSKANSNRNCNFFIAKPTHYEFSQTFLNLTTSTETSNIQNRYRLVKNINKQIIPFHLGVGDRLINQDNLKSNEPKEITHKKGNSAINRLSNMKNNQHKMNLKTFKNLDKNQSDVAGSNGTGKKTYYLRQTRTTTMCNENQLGDHSHWGMQNKFLRTRNNTNYGVLSKTEPFRNTQNDLKFNRIERRNKNDSLKRNTSRTKRQQTNGSDSENPVQVNHSGIYSNYIITLRSKKVQRMEDLVFVVKDI